MRVDTTPLRNLWEENKTLKEQNQALQKELKRLRKIIHGVNGLYASIDEINADTDVVELLHEILEVGLEAANSSDGSIQLIDTETNELVFVEVIGHVRDRLIGFRMPVDEGIAGWVVTNKSPTIVMDAREDSRWSPRVDQMIGFETTSLISVPLMNGDHVIGSMEMVNAHHNLPFTIEDLDVLLLIGHLTSTAITKAEEFVSD